MKPRPAPTAPTRRPSVASPPAVLPAFLAALAFAAFALLGATAPMALAEVAEVAEVAGEAEAPPPPPAAAPATMAGADDRFLEANAAFAEGRFEEARLGYLSLVEAGLSAPELFYNLGTTRYREEAPGEAMLWLRRALVLDPGFDEARQNIGFLRARIPYLVFDGTFAERWLRSLRPGYGRWAISMCLWIAVIAAAAPYALPRLREGRGRFLTIAAVSLVFAVFFWRVHHLQQTRYSPEAYSIVTGEEVAALTAPAPDAREVIELPPGSEVRVLERSGAWAYLEIPGRLRGWVRSEQVASLWPVP